MDASAIAKVHAAGRVLVGTGLTLAPGPAGAGWIGKVAGERPVTVFSRALGIRDAVLGLGVLAHASDSQAVRPWVMAGLAADVVDALASYEAREQMPPSGRMVGSLVAGGSSVLGAWLLAKLR